MTQRKKEQVKMDLPLVRPINDVEVDINKGAIFCFFCQTIYLLNLLKADIYSFKSLLFFSFEINFGNGYSGGMFDFNVRTLF